MGTPRLPRGNRSRSHTPRAHPTKDIDALRAELAAAIGKTVDANRKKLKKLGYLSEKELSKLANGNGNPTLDTLARLSVMLERSVSDLLRTSAAAAFQGRLDLEAERLGKPDDRVVWRATMDEVHTANPDRVIAFIAKPDLRIPGIEIDTVDVDRMVYDWTIRPPEGPGVAVRFRACVTEEVSRGTRTFTIKGQGTATPSRPRVAEVWGQWQVVPVGRIFHIYFGFVAAIEPGDEPAIKRLLERYGPQLADYMKQQFETRVRLFVSDYDFSR